MESEPFVGYEKMNMFEDRELKFAYYSSNMTNKRTDSRLLHLTA